jgi:hypothetical protein
MSGKRKLITSAEATPAGKQIKRPCSDCPWARDALNGWLGGNTAHEWIIMAHGETLIECHVHPDVQCAGAAIYRANVSKVPRDRALLVLPADNKIVFANPGEFHAHHAATPERKLKERQMAKRDANKVPDKIDEVLSILDAVAGDESWSRAEYRELLEEIMSHCDVCIGGLDADDARDAREGKEGS